MWRRVGIFNVVGSLGLAAASAASPLARPDTARRSVKDSYHGVEVSDDYRWLENWNEPAVKAWSEAQNAYARSFLDGLSGRAELRERITALLRSVTSYGQVKRKGSTLFALRYDPRQEQPVLVTLKDPDDPASARVVVDLNAVDPKGGTSMSWYAPSEDGQIVAVSLAAGGSERGTLHVYETATGRELPDVIPRVNYGTAGGSACWAPSGGFYYTRYPREGERPTADVDFYVHVYFHALGTPTTQDRYEIGREFPRIAEIALECNPHGLVLANVANGDGGEFAQYLRGADGKWIQLTGFPDKVPDAAFGPGPSLYFVSRQEAPHGKVLRLSLEDGPPVMSRARVVVPQPADGVVEFLVTTPSHLCVREGVGGPNRVRIFDLMGKQQSILPLPPVSSVFQLLAFGGEAVLYRATSFVQPSTWYSYDADRQSEPRRLAISSRSPADFTDVEVIRETASSRDGTRVPMTILRRRGARLDGNNATLLTGYGGFGISLGPGFNPILRTWLDQGGVYAIANLRGGGEFGEEWHQAGSRIHKQNVFDDFIACAERLISLGYTRPARLAIEGGSNGGLLMGAAMTQRPDLFKAVVSHVGIYDMLRVELSTNGEFNVPEFGTVKNLEQFRAMYRYSPYHHVAEGTAYPAVLFLTGANDPRVDPMQSRKMTARLQAATGDRGLILLRTSASSGHGVGTALGERIEQDVDVLAFLFDQLGIRYPSSGSPAAMATPARDRSLR